MIMKSSNYSIGGYFELECMNNSFYYSEPILLNSGRNALRYIIQTYNIKKLFVPAYTCHEVIESIKLEDCILEYYNLNEQLLPIKSFQSNEYILYTNYFGICGNNVIKLNKIYPNLIVDNSQAFYFTSKSLAAFYSPRKFFGLPDGGFVLSDRKLSQKLELDSSYDRCEHLLMRWDKGPEYGYSKFKSNDENLKDLPIKKMSKLTKALMGNINYEKIKQNRIDNFRTLNKYLNNSNESNLQLSSNDVPMVYPYLINDETIRERLIQNKIYIANYWPNIEKLHPINNYEKYLQKFLFPLPVDQRYNEKDMKTIVEVILG